MARVLIVDDEPRIRDLIREHLQYAGFTCAEAGDGTQALAELANGGIDLVILDIMMPFMDGMTCLREMRTRKIMTPVIMLTARSEEYDKLEAALQADVPVSIRINQRKGTGAPATPAVAWSETGYYLPQRLSFTFDPLFHAGAYYVQEASSMFLELHRAVNPPIC